MYFYVYNFLLHLQRMMLINMKLYINGYHGITIYYNRGGICAATFPTICHQHLPSGADTGFPVGGSANPGGGAPT